MVRLCFLAFLLLNGVMYVRGQTNLPLVESNVNVDSIILDSMRKAYILNHKPLAKSELSRFSKKRTADAYGEFIQPMIDQVSIYSMRGQSSLVHAPRMRRQNKEWIFYMFCALALYAAFINRYSNRYLRQMFRAFFDDGFIFRQVKDQLSQMPYVSFFFNLLFLITGALFIYFGLEWDDAFYGIKRWALLGGVALLILTIYGLKTFFLRSMGWAFGLKESFNNYVFVVSLQNKLLSLFLFLSAFMMAFSSGDFSDYIFRFAVAILIFIYAFRLIRGFQIFTGQARLKFFSVLLAFVSLEALPTALLIKFLSRSMSLLVEGWM
jgi:hypothetical protein